MPGSTLGTRDYSGLVVVERLEVAPARSFGRPTEERHVRHIERFALGTPYPAIVERVCNLMQEPIMRHAKVVLDATGRTKQEQADLIDQGSKALERGDLQFTLAVKPAADVLGMFPAEFDDALRQADPVRQEAATELAYITKLRDSYSADVTRRHVYAGMATDTEKVAAVSDPYDLGTPAGRMHHRL